jgi:hypothetical protein
MRGDCEDEEGAEDRAGKCTQPKLTRHSARPCPGRHERSQIGYLPDDFDLAVFAQMIDKCNEVCVDPCCRRHENRLSPNGDRCCGKLLCIRVRSSRPTARQKITKFRVATPIEDALQSYVELTQHTHYDAVEHNQMARIRSAVTEVTNAFEKRCGGFNRCVECAKGRFHFAFDACIEPPTSVSKRAIRIQGFTRTMMESPDATAPRHELAGGDDSVRIARAPHGVRCIRLC